MANNNALFRVEIDGLEEINKAITKVSHIAKPHEITRVVREELLVIHNEYFEKRQAPDGTKWKNSNKQYLN